MRNRILCLSFALALAAAPAGAAPTFSDAWNTQALYIGRGLLDADPGRDLLVLSGLTGRFQLRNATTGALEYEFPSGYGLGNYYPVTTNLDTDTNDELVLYSSPDGNPATARIGLFDLLGPVATEGAALPPPTFGPRWELTGYGSISEIFFGSFESDGVLDIVVTTAVTFRIHDFETGAVKYDWAVDGPDPYQFLGINVEDFEGDGRDEILVHVRHQIDGYYEIHLVRSNAALGTEGPAFESRPLAAQNAPNPFSGPTRIEFLLPARDRVTVTIYDTAGRRVRGLLDETREAGRHALTWDGHDDGGRALRSGVYFYEVEAAGQRLTRKMLRVR